MPANSGGVHAGAGTNLKRALPTGYDVIVCPPGIQPLR
jgi:hypothetical protein